MKNEFNEIYKDRSERAIENQGNRLKDGLDTYDLFRLNLILKPDGSRESKCNE